MENCSDGHGCRVVAYFDVDCFYAQAEVLRRPHLQGRPVGVTQKFLVVTCNYEARQRGVPKMASIQTAKERCPDLLLFNGEDLTPYRAASKNIMVVLGRFGVLERRGLDEAALDITVEVMKRSVSMPKCQGFSGHVLGLMDLHENGCDLYPISSSNYVLMVGSQLVSEIRAAVERETGFRCSSGIATNKMLAKLVSSVNKPNQQTCILESGVSAFLNPLSVRKLPGIGHHTESLLKDMGITTVAGLQQSTLQQLSAKFGNRLGTILFENCRGVDKSVVQDKGPPKSLSIEDSFRPCTSFKQAEGIIKSLAPDLIARLDEDKDEYYRRPKVFTIKWRYPGNWAFRSSSAPMPHELLSSSISMEKRLETVVEIAMKLLSQSLRSQPFSFVVLNIGATNFTVTSNGSSFASHDIRSFLNSPLKSSQDSPLKVVSKREARVNREESETGRLGVKCAQPVIENLDIDDAYVRAYIRDTQELEKFVCDEELDEADRCPLKHHKLDSFTEQPLQELRELPPFTNGHTAPSLIGKTDESPTKAACEVESSEPSGIVDMNGSLAVQHDESGSASADYLGSTLVDEHIICVLCGEEVRGDIRSKQEHEDYHYALELNSREQTSATFMTLAPTRSKQMTMKNHHHVSPKRSKTQNERKRTPSGTLDCFFFRSQG